MPNQYTQHSTTIEERFWSRVDTNGPVPAHRPELGPCWLWTGPLAADGYGVAKVDGRSPRAHRRAWQLVHGAITKGMLICHRCDNRRCVRPSHLFEGTQQDNMTDKVAKGRQAKGDRNGSRLHPECLKRGDENPSRLHPELLRRGETHHMCKLTEDQVRTIRQRYAAGGISQPQLSREYGVGLSQINRILQGQTWRHVL